MEVNKFDNKEQLEGALVKKLSFCISEAIVKYGNARILLSGGSTPLHLYSLFSNELIDWEKLDIGLVDERFVPQESVYSNETQIRNTLLQNAGKNGRLCGMVYVTDDEVANLKMVNEAYRPFFERVDFTLLGMGLDGHTASIFPDDNESEAVMKLNTLGVYSTKAPNFPFNRITCSKDLILSSNSMALMIQGEDKLRLIEDSTKTNLPISYFIENAKNMEIYCTT